MILMGLLMRIDHSTVEQFEDISIDTIEVLHGRRGNAKTKEKTKEGNSDRRWRMQAPWKSKQEALGKIQKR